MKTVKVISLKIMSNNMQKLYPILLLTLLFGQSEKNFNGAFGTVTMDGKIWNQLAFRPEYSMGNFGLALDLVFYFDENGNIHKDEWDFSDGNSIKNSLIDKIYYLRYGFPGDPLYGKMGALDQVNLGYGILVDGYSNAIEYPQVRKIGLDFEFTKGLYFYQGFVNDFKENIGLFGMRTQTTALLSFPVGISFVMDRNQYFGLKDKDGDGRPDLVDDFPENNSAWLDTDNDGLADSDPNEWDIDGDGITDILNNSIPGWTGDDFVLDSSIVRKGEPLNLSEDADPISAFSIDVGLPVLQKDSFSLIMYAQFAKMIGETKSPENPDSNLALGSGLIPLGLRAEMGPVNLVLEYRMIPNGRFEFGFWNRSYEVERATVSQVNNYTTIVTKESKLGYRGKQKGVYFGIQTSLFSLLDGSISYQTLNGDQWNSEKSKFINESNQSFMTSINLNKKISKLSRAEIFYQQKNVPNPFEFVFTESTIMGYRLGISMGEGLVVNYVFKRMFRDINGNGKIENSEAINLTGIETSFGL